MYYKDTEVARNCNVFNDHQALSRIIDARRGTGRLLLSFRLGVVVPLFRDLGRVAVRAGHPLGPTHRSDGLKAPGIVNEVQDVQHPCTHHPS